MLASQRPAGSRLHNRFLQEGMTGTLPHQNIRATEASQDRIHFYPSDVFWEGCAVPSFQG